MGRGGRAEEGAMRDMVDWTDWRRAVRGEGREQAGAGGSRRGGASDGGEGGGGTRGRGCAI